MLSEIVAKCRCKDVVDQLGLTFTLTYVAESGRKGETEAGPQRETIAV